MNTAINHFPRTPDAGVVAVLPSKLSVSETKKLSQYEQIIERGLQTFLEVGSTFARVRDEQLWREGYSSFKDYLSRRWQITDRHGRHMIEAAKVVENLKASDPAMPLPLTESQARPLTALPPSQVPEVWKAALASAPAGKVTAKHVQAAVEQKRAKKNPRVILLDEWAMDEAHKAYAAMALSGPEPCNIPRPLDYEGDLYCVGAFGSGGSKPAFAEGYQLIPTGNYRGPESSEWGYEGHRVKWKDKTYRLGPMVIFQAAAKTKVEAKRPPGIAVVGNPGPLLKDFGDAMRKKFFALSQEAVESIRRLQDLLPSLRFVAEHADNAVHEIEAMEGEMRKMGKPETDVSPTPEASIAGWVLWRKPMKGAICPDHRFCGDTASGWTNHPERITKPFTTRRAALRVNRGDTVISVSRALEISKASK